MKAKSERRRPFIGNQIEECRDASGLFYILGFQRGYLVNWDVQVILNLFYYLNILISDHLIFDYKTICNEKHGFPRDQTKTQLINVIN